MHNLITTVTECPRKRQAKWSKRWYRIPAKGTLKTKPAMKTILPLSSGSYFKTLIITIRQTHRDLCLRSPRIIFYHIRKWAWSPWSPTYCNIPPSCYKNSSVLPWPIILCHVNVHLLEDINWKIVIGCCFIYKVKCFILHREGVFFPLFLFSCFCLISARETSCIEQ